MTQLSSSYPPGAFEFDDWWAQGIFPADVVQGAQKDFERLARAAFEAGYVSAVRHHDAAMATSATDDMEGLSHSAF